MCIHCSVLALSLLLNRLLTPYHPSISFFLAVAKARERKRDPPLLSTLYINLSRLLLLKKKERFRFFFFPLGRRDIHLLLPPISMKAHTLGKKGLLVMDREKGNRNSFLFSKEEELKGRRRVTRVHSEEEEGVEDQEERWGPRRIRYHWQPLFSHLPHFSLFLFFSFPLCTVEQKL